MLITPEPWLRRGFGLCSPIPGLHFATVSAPNPFKRAGACSPSQLCLATEQLKDVCSRFPLWNTNCEQKMPEGVVGDERGVLCWEYFHSPLQLLGCFPPCLPLHPPQLLKPWIFSSLVQISRRFLVQQLLVPSCSGNLSSFGDNTGGAESKELVFMESFRLEKASKCPVTNS